jgi:hypothetical protein
LPTNQHLVIVCPLDWGLGHASRMIPVIVRFMACGYRVILGGDGKSGELLRKNFPQLSFIQIPSPVIRYTGKGAWLIPLLVFQLPKMLFSVIREHYLIKKIVIAHGVDIIISDNRYGLFCRHAHSVFITHQISPVLPAMLRWAEYPLHIVIRTLILRFNECWIPDYADPQQNLSGKLSHRFKLPKNARFVGILSRFNKINLIKGRPSRGEYELVVVLSGPEPQLSIFSDVIIRQALMITHKTLVISGLRENPRPLPESAHSRLTIVSHLEPENFGYAMLHADIIVCRSGYSGIMDLVALEKTAVLIPTPGQSEQQYLAGYLSKKGWFSYLTQQELDLGNLMKNKENRLSFHSMFNLNGCEGLPIAPISNGKNR